MKTSDTKKIQKRLIERLEAEVRFDLAEKLRKCGTPKRIRCSECMGTHDVEERCKMKWCPVCVRQIAARRAKKYRSLVAAMQWPLFITLTMGNVPDLSFDAVRHLRRAFGRLRAKKIWKQTVKGGVASIEVTNTGNGFHPHLHAVLDCRWLAIKTREPRRGDSRETIKALCQAAAEELQKAWTKCLRQQKPASIKVKRASEGVEDEVLKYAVKGAELVECEGEIGPLIDCLTATRLVTSFGNVYAVDVPEEPKVPMACKHCGKSAKWLPDEMLSIYLGMRGRRLGWGELADGTRKSGKLSAFESC